MQTCTVHALEVHSLYWIQLQIWDTQSYDMIIFSCWSHVVMSFKHHSWPSEKTQRAKLHLLMKMMWYKLQKRLLNTPCQLLFPRSRMGYKTHFHKDCRFQVRPMMTRFIPMICRYHWHEPHIFADTTQSNRHYSTFSALLRLVLQHNPAEIRQWHKLNWIAPQCDLHTAGHNQSDL